MTSIVIRRAVESDLDTIVQLRIEFLSHVRDPDFVVPQGFAESTTRFIEHAHRSKELHSWLAIDESVTDSSSGGGAAVGIVAVMLRPRPPQPEDFRTIEGYIINMYVRPSHQRRGIARGLFEQCLSSAGEFGVRKFMLHTTNDGRALYSSAGFEPKSNWLELRVAANRDE